MTDFHDITNVVILYNVNCDLDGDDKCLSLSSFTGPSYLPQKIIYLIYSCTRKFGHPCAAATLLAISPDVYNLASRQLLLR